MLFCFLITNCFILIGVVNCNNMTQSDALSILKMGKNVFLTGGAGTGKTYVINQIIEHYRSHDVSIAITASTGIAATHIGGITIHAWSGMGIKEQLTNWDIELLEEKKYLWDRYQKTQVLIIDEISMLSGSFLSSLDRLCKAMKRMPGLPFGGMQVIFCGDLFQLPPVGSTDGTDLVIDASIWNEMNLTVCYLQKQYRQKDDKFTEILNALRAGATTPAHVKLLESRVKEYDPDDYSNVTKLFTHNQDVDAVNAQSLDQLYDDGITYPMSTKGKENLIQVLKKSCLAPEKLVIKIDTEVMFVKNNFEAGYVNGTRGRVIDFDDDEMPIVLTLAGDKINVTEETWMIDDNGKVLASITQLPLRHAWAITVHKSQGMSLDSAVIDLSKSFAYGMGYVALSRVRTLEGLHLIGFSESALLVDPRILQRDKQLQNISDQFIEKLGELSDEEIIKRHMSTIERFGGSLKKNKKPTIESVSTRKTHEITFDLLELGKILPEIARERELLLGTVIEHIQKCKESGKSLRDFPHITIDQELLSRVREAIELIKEPGQKVTDVKLTPVKRYLEKSGFDDTFDAIKFARLFID